ncbi:3868_t:CDS:2, partial [Ambispora leptoticha]
KHQEIKKLKTQLTQEREKVNAEQAAHANTQAELARKETNLQIIQEQLTAARGTITHLTTECQQQKQRADTYETDLKTEFNIPEAERDNYLQQRDHYQNQLATHTCSPLNCPQPCCQGDYERLQQKLTTQKKQILQKINNSLELGLTSRELSLKKVISKIEELLRNPATELTHAQQTIKLLKKQLTTKVPDYQTIQQAEYQKLLQLVKEDTLQN